MLDANAMGALEGLGVTVSDEELDERIASMQCRRSGHHRVHVRFHARPKGAELTHRNFVSITRAGSLALHEMILDDHPRLLLFLPLAHCFARFIQYASIASDDGVVGYLPDTKTLLPTCAFVRADVPARRAARVREGVQRGFPQGRHGLEGPPVPRPPSPRATGRACQQGGGEPP